MHDAQAFRDDRDERVAPGARCPRGRAQRQRPEPLHVAGDGGRLTGAFVLCRYGADPARKDASGKTPYDLARSPTIPRDPNRMRPEDDAHLVEWLKPMVGASR